MVSETNKPYVAGKEADPLAENLLGLLAAPALMKDIGEANRTKAREDFEQQKMIEAYDQLFIRTISA